MLAIIQLVNNLKNNKLMLQIFDKPIIPKAKLTLPDELTVDMLADGTSSVYTKLVIKKGTQFGPFLAKKSCTLLPSITFPLKIFSSNDEDLSECYLDTSDENECSWMMYIAAANGFEEQNLICFQVSIESINNFDEILYIMCL